MLFIRVHHGLGVASRRIAVAGPFQRRTHVGVVEDLAVVDNPGAAGFVGHGLVAARDIDDAQASMAQRSPRVLVITGVIRTAVPDGVGHALQHRPVFGRRFGGYVARDSAHRTAWT